MVCRLGLATDAVCDEASGSSSRTSNESRNTVSHSLKLSHVYQPKCVRCLHGSTIVYLRVKVDLPPLTNEFSAVSKLMDRRDLIRNL